MLTNELKFFLICILFLIGAQTGWPPVELGVGIQNVRVSCLLQI